MQKLLFVLGFVAIVSAQTLPITNQLANFTSNLQGEASFGTSVASSALVTFSTIPDQSVTTSGAISFNYLGASVSTGLTATFTAFSSQAGNFVVDSVLYASSATSFSGISNYQSSASLFLAGAAGLNLNFGFNYSTDLAPGSYNLTVNIAFTPSVILPSPTISANLQLFYAVNTSDGSGQNYLSSSNGFFGTLTAQPALPLTGSGNAQLTPNITFILPPVSAGVVIAAQVDFATGTSVVGSTTPVVPVLFGTVAKVYANAYTAYIFSKNFIILLSNQVATTISTTFNTAYDSEVGFTGGFSAGATETTYLFNTSNTFYANVSFTTSVAQQVGLASTLAYNTSTLVKGTATRFFWAFYNATSNQAVILQDSVYDATTGSLTVSVSHYSTYAVYGSSAPSNSTTTTTSATSSSSTTTITSSTFTTSTFTTSSNTINGAATVPTAPTGAAAALAASAALVIAAVLAF